VNAGFPYGMNEGNSGLPAWWLYFDAKRLTDPRMTAETMRVIVNLLGNRDPAETGDLPGSAIPALKDALRALKNQLGAPLDRFLKEDLSRAEGSPSW